MDNTTNLLAAPFIVLCAAALYLSGCSARRPVKAAPPPLPDFTLSYDSPTDPALQAELERIDAELRAKQGMGAEHTDLGLLDLKTGRLALIRPDKIEYAASVAKIGILYAYFQLHPEAAECPKRRVRKELGLMAKISSDAMAAKYSRELGLRRIQETLTGAGFYDKERGGGIWVGKHYGKGGERIGDPIADHSHAVTVRQVMRYFLLLEQGRLVSPEASRTMREIFASPKLPHDDIKFVKGLAGRGLDIIRKWGSWEDWLHDAAVVTGPGRHYILVALTHHPRGDAYLEDLAKAVDDVMARDASAKPAGAAD